MGNTENVENLFSIRGNTSSRLNRSLVAVELKTREFIDGDEPRLWFHRSNLYTQTNSSARVRIGEKHEFLTHPMTLSHCIKFAEMTPFS
jgi:hypothetical protein